MSDLDELIFRGTSAQECEDFVRCVRRVALSRGKEEDDRWIAHYATSGFTGLALRWFEALDEEAQRDWKKLRKAMLKRWSDDKADDLVENLSAVSLAPTPPAAAPPLAQPLQTSSSFLETQSSTTKRGYIRVDGIPSTRTAYLHRRPHSTGAFGMTVQAQDKALVEVVAGAPPYRIRLLNVKDRAWLGLKWKLIPSIKGGKIRWAGLIPLDESGEFHCECTPPGLAGPHRSIIWSIALDGTIQAWWNEGVTCLLECVYRHDYFVIFAPDPDAYVSKYPEWTRARLVFEPAS